VTESVIASIFFLTSKQIDVNLLVLISITSEENLQYQEAATKYEAIITKNFYQKEQKAHF
jgi:hypothetical protein